MNELMQREIRDQPRLAAEELPRLRAEAAAALAALPRRAERLVLTGCGDSWIASLALAPAARTLLGPGCAVHVEQSLEAAAYFPFAPGDVLVASSVSGGVARTVEAAEAARRAGAAVIALTARPESRLAGLADGLVRLPEPIARNTPHSRDYLAALIALGALLEALSGRAVAALDQIGGVLGAELPGWEARAAELAPALAAAERLFLLGAGPSWASSLYGAAKLWEAGGVLGIAQEVEELAHGGHLLIRWGDAAVLIAPSGPSATHAARMLPGMLRLGLRVVVLTEESARFSGAETVALPAFPDLWSPLLTAVPLQLLCGEIAAVRGLDVTIPLGGRPDGATSQAVHVEWTRGATAG